MKCFAFSLTQEITRLLLSQWPHTRAYVNASLHGRDCRAHRILALCWEEWRAWREWEGCKFKDSWVSLPELGRLRAQRL